MPAANLRFNQREVSRGDWSVGPFNSLTVIKTSIAEAHLSNVEVRLQAAS